ncbi:O-antigen ligase family protein [Chitinophaga barathri]|uniref:Tetratricopeptide repeat protein n=1 Tax=Chitinophaga barathri TaxID=1647451 RepID=A0A3N4M4Y7_9BACT|nr:O-antigen ligase family protein [Chitinophaga barathri]RPD38231.1 tetratricopeptide repeat protein [Chitinophaga barathri]
MKKESLLTKMAGRYGGNTLAVEIVTICLLLAVIARSRAYVCGYSAALLLTLMMHPALKPRKWYLYAAAVLLLALPLLLAAGLKQDSSRGRLLIYKVSTNILKEHFPSGIGWGRYKEVYNYYQADYFRKGAYTEKEMLLADNTWFAFNDYYQWLIEGGWIAAALIPLCLALIIFLCIRALQKRNTPLNVSAVAQLAAIMIAACFTHVFERPLPQFITVFSLSVIIGLRWQISLVPTVFVCLIHYGQYLLHFRSYQQLAETKELLATGSRAQALDNFDTLYPVLQNEPGFLKLYGTHLLEMNQPARAVPVLEEANRRQPQNTWLIKLAEAYEANAQTKQAEDTYLVAAYMVPNRFVSKMKLFTFYQRQQRPREATFWGKAILEQPVKVPSRQVNSIRDYISANMIVQ